MKVYCFKVNVQEMSDKYYLKADNEKFKMSMINHKITTKII